MGTYFAYARVSTPRQGEKGVSLQEQKAAIERYAAIHALEITRWFEERESASQIGRPAFSEMLKLLRLRRAQGVVIHKIDRSARNMQDWADVGKLADAGVEVHFANENVDLKTVSGRLSADIQAVVAAHYSRNLREEVKKGLYGRLKQGIYPLRAPIGYLDTGAAKPKVPDPARAPFVKDAFRLYASGTVSLPDLTKEMFRRGLRNRNGGAVSMTGIATMLGNPFYIGLMRIFRTGQTFVGNHEPLIPAELFENVQAVRAGKRSDRKESRLFTYSRLVRCKTCGYSLIAEEQKGHVYYRCHDRPFKNPAVCPTTSIREEQIDAAILVRLARIGLSDDELQFARQRADQHLRESEENRSAKLHAYRLQLEKLRERLARLTDLVVDGTVEKSAFGTKQKEILVEEARIKERLADAERGASAATVRMQSTVELARCPSNLYKTASPEKRRELLKILLSNLTVCGKNVELTLALPFRLIAERQKTDDCGQCRGTCRTWEEVLIELERYAENHTLAA